MCLAVFSRADEIKGEEPGFLYHLMGSYDAILGEVTRTKELQPDWRKLVTGCVSLGLSPVLASPWHPSCLYVLPAVKCRTAFAAMMLCPSTGAKQAQTKCSETVRWHKFLLIEVAIVRCMVTDVRVI